MNTKSILSVREWHNENVGCRIHGKFCGEPSGCEGRYWSDQDVANYAVYYSQHDYLLDKFYPTCYAALALNENPPD